MFNMAGGRLRVLFLGLIVLISVPSFSTASAGKHTPSNPKEVLFSSAFKHTCTNSASRILIFAQSFRPLATRSSDNNLLCNRTPVQALIKLGDVVHDAVYPHEPTFTERVQEAVHDAIHPHEQKITERVHEVVSDALGHSKVRNA